MPDRHTKEQTTTHTAPVASITRVNANSPPLKRSRRYSACWSTHSWRWEPLDSGDWSFVPYRRCTAKVSITGDHTHTHTHTLSASSVLKSRGGTTQIRSGKRPQNGGRQARFPMRCYSSRAVPLATKRDRVTDMLVCTKLVQSSELHLLQLPSPCLGSTAHAGQQDSFACGRKEKRASDVAAYTRQVRTMCLVSNPVIANKVHAQGTARRVARQPF